MTYETFEGLPNLNDDNTRNVRQAMAHWRGEIKAAVEAGKTVIVLLAPLEEFKVGTGERKYSGTGRSRSVTRVVATTNNYHCLPLDLKVTSARGRAIRLAQKESDFLVDYWSLIGDRSEYVVTISSDLENLKPILLTRIGERMVGAVAMYPSGGAIVLLPEVDSTAQDFLDDEDNWTPAAEVFAHNFIAAILSIDKNLRPGSDATPAPSWASNPTFELGGERELSRQLTAAEVHLTDAQQRYTVLQKQVEAAAELRGLLFEKGKRLEHLVREALTRLGFTATAYRDASSEFDVVFECPEGRLIGEVEGKDTKPINVDKLRQLTMNISEDLQRDDVAAPAKGVLFGNGYRLAAPTERAMAFTEKCIGSAPTYSVALVPTTELFRVVAYLSKQEDESFARACRDALLTTVGILSFPDTPDLQASDATKAA